MIERLACSIGTDFDFVFLADGVMIESSFTFVTKSQSTFIELAIHPSPAAASTSPSLFIYVAAGDRRMSRTYDTGIKLDFTEALVLHPMTSFLIDSSTHNADRVYALQLEGTGLHFLEGATVTRRDGRIIGTVTSAGICLL